MYLQDAGSNPIQINSVDLKIILISIYLYNCL